MTNKKLKKTLTVPLAAAFYSEDGNVDRELVKVVMAMAANRKSLSPGKYMGSLSKLLMYKGEKKLKNVEERIDWLAAKLSDLNFRSRWYKKIVPKEGDNFFNLLHYYLLSEHSKFLDNEKKNKHFFWEKHSGSGSIIFLHPERLGELLRYFLDENMDRRALALYLWAFHEAQTWYVENKEVFGSDSAWEASLREALSGTGEEELLRLCLPPTYVAGAEDGASELESGALDLISPELEKKGGSKSPSPASIQEEVGTLERVAKAQYSSREDDSENNDQAFDRVLVGEDLRSDPRYESAIEAIDTLYAILDGNQELVRLMVAADYAGISRVAQQTDENNAHFQTLLEQIRSKFTEYDESFALDEPVSDVFRSEPSARNFIKTFLSSIDKSLEKSVVKLKEKKDRMRANFQELGVPVPDDLEQVRNLEELNRLDEEWKPRLRMEDVYVRCVKRGIEGAGLETLPPSQRNDLLKRLVGKNTGNAVMMSSLMDWAVKNGDIINQEDMFFKDIYLDILRVCLENDQDLPIGAWRPFQGEIMGQAFDMLKHSGVFSLLENIQTIDEEGLLDTFGEQTQKLPSGLQIRLALATMNKLSPGARVQRVATLVAKHPEREDLCLSLLRELFNASRVKEGFFLASLFGLSYLASSMEGYIKSPFMDLCLDSVDGDDFSNSVFYEILENLDWVDHEDGTMNEKDILILFYIFWRGHLDSQFMNFRYHFADDINKCRARHPVLVNYLVTACDRLEASNAEEPEDTGIVEAGSKALIDFKRNLKRISCYSKWPPGSKYQSYINQALSRALAQTRREGAVPGIDIDELIENAQQEFDLNVAKGDAARNLKRYFWQQMGRIRLINNALGKVSYKDLEEKPTAISERMEKEAGGVSDSSLLKKIYTQMIRVV